jgi:hypothetical protein
VYSLLSLRPNRRLFHHSLLQNEKRHSFVLVECVASTCSDWYLVFPPPASPSPQLTTLKVLVFKSVFAPLPALYLGGFGPCSCAPGIRFIKCGLLGALPQGWPRVLVIASTRPRSVSWVTFIRVLHRLHLAHKASSLPSHFIPTCSVFAVLSKDSEGGASRP